jgi:hypothetical protein
MYVVWFYAESEGFVCLYSMHSARHDLCKDELTVAVRATESLIPVVPPPHRLDELS